jgi:protein-tyrosine phosphatase
MGPIPPLEAVRNLRSLGGLPTGDGRRVVQGRLFRSASLQDMTPSDRVALEGLGIRTVIDLRSRFEQRRQPYEWTRGIKVAAPLADDASVAAIFDRFREGSLTVEEVQDWWQLTGVFTCPQRHPGSFRIVFRTLLDAEPGEGVLFHCTGGKDRAGVVAALILEALGVTRSAIMQDFLLSNADAEARAAEHVEWMRRATGRALGPELAYWLAGVKPEWLEILWGQLAEGYGSVAGYLQQAAGVGPQEAAALRAKYLEVAPH